MLRPHQIQRGHPTGGYGRQAPTVLCTARETSACTRAEKRARLTSSLGLAAQHTLITCPHHAHVSEPVCDAHCFSMMLRGMLPSLGGGGSARDAARVQGSQACAAKAHPFVK